MLKQTFAALIVLSGGSGVAAAQTAGGCAAPSFADRAELKPVAGSNLMTVPVSINGTAKQFLLDIGNNPDEISEAAVAELNLPQVDQRTPVNAMAEKNATFQFQAPVFDVRGTGTPRNYQPRVRAAAFTLGGVTVPNLGFLVSN